MRRIMAMLVSVALASCGQSGPGSTANEMANSAAAEKPKPPHCFFKDADTRDWKATRDKDGNIAVKGKAYREDPRYKALLNPATVTGTTAEITPTIAQNDTGYGAPENWWELSATIPNSASVDTVDVRCGATTIAQLKVAPKG